MQKNSKHKTIFCGIAAWLITGFLFAAEPTKPLTGRVVDENGNPLAGATVMVTGRNENGILASIVTGADGRFDFDGQLREKLAMLVAIKQGKCLDWNISSQTSADEPVLRLRPAAVIEGVIVDDSEKPVCGASVRASLRLEAPAQRDIHYRSAGGILTVKTDKEGRFRFSNIPADAILQFDMSAAGYAWSCATGPFVPGQKGLRFILPPEGKLEGIVVEKKTGRPLAGLCLALLGTATGEPRFVETKTDADGRFSFAGLGEDSYDIEIVGPDLPDAVVIGNNVFVGQEFPEWIGSEQEVHVEAGKVVSSIKIEACKGGTAKLMLTDRATGQPINSPAVLYASPTADRHTRHFGIAKDDGIAKFYLTPGEHVVTEVMAPGFFYWSHWESNKPFQVEEDKTTSVVVSLGKIPRVAGMVRDPAGQPIAGAKIQVLPFGGGHKDLVADDDGRFSISPADQTVPGFHIVVRDPQRSLTAIGLVEVHEPSQEEKSLREKGFSILHGSEGDITLRDPIAVSGRVMDMQERPVADATIKAYITLPSQMGGRSDVVATAQTNKDGEYKIELGGVLVMGSYLLSAMAPGYGVMEKQVATDDFGREVMARKRVGSPTKIEQNYALNKADRMVQGIVKDRQGNPTPGALVIAHPTGYRVSPLCSVADSKGRFILEHLDGISMIYVIAQVPGRNWIGRSTVKPGKTETVIEVGPAAWD